MTERTPRPAGELLLVVISWLAVGLPLAWGVAMTLQKALLLFRPQAP